MQDKKWESSFIVLHVIFGFPRTCCWRGCLFQCMFCDFCQKLGDYRCVGVFLSCLFHHFTCLSLCQCHMVFVIITSLYNLISDISSVSFCLELFWYSGSLAGLHEYLGPIKQFKNQTPKKKIIRLINRMKVNKQNYPRNTFNVFNILTKQENTN